MNIQPDWEAIASNISDELSDDEINATWDQICQQWLKRVASEYGSDYRIESTANFLILSNESTRYVDVFSAFLERTLKRILKALNGVANDEGNGKHVAMIFKDADDYYHYISRFYPEDGEFGLRNL